MMFAKGHFLSDLIRCCLLTTIVLALGFATRALPFSEIRVANNEPTITLPALSIAASVQDQPEPTDDSKPSSPTTDLKRQREGESIKDSKAKFEHNGLRYVLHRSGNQPPLTVLENLAMERIAEFLTKSGSDSSWFVEGTVTEFQGSNFVLIKRAHVNSISGGTK